MLSEQVNAQNDKISDLERLITDKAQLISNTEDLLQRVSGSHLRSGGRRLNHPSPPLSLARALAGNAVAFVAGDAEARVDVGDERAEAVAGRVGAREPRTAGDALQQQHAADGTAAAGFCNNREAARKAPNSLTPFPANAAVFISSAARHAIQQPAAADVSGIGDGRLALQHRRYVQ